MKFMKSLVMVAVLSLGALAYADGTINPPQIPVLRFAKVTEGIYRGARPDAAGMDALAKAGIRTDIDLEDAADFVSAESNVAQKLGIDFLTFPMSGFFAPDDQQVEKILTILGDPTRQPIFIHCQHGQDRTGLIVGLYRVRYQGWAPKDAYTEMLNLGFHQILFPLNHYFETKTGFDD